MATGIGLVSVTRSKICTIQTLTPPPPLLLPHPHHRLGCGIQGTKKMTPGRSEPSQRTPATSWAPLGLQGPTPALSVEGSSVQHKPSVATWTFTAATVLASTKPHPSTTTTTTTTTSPLSPAHTTRPLFSTSLTLRTLSQMVGCASCTPSLALTLLHSPLLATPLVSIMHVPTLPPLFSLSPLPFHTLSQLPQMPPLISRWRSLPQGGGPFSLLILGKRNKNPQPPPLVTANTRSLI